MDATSQIHLSPFEGVDFYSVEKDFEADDVGKRYLSFYGRETKEWINLIGPNHFALKAVVDDARIGFVDISFEMGYIGTFLYYIRPMYRGRGLAKPLLLALHDWVIQNSSVAYLDATIDETNHASLRVAAQVGMEHTGQTEDMVEFVWNLHRGYVQN